MDPVWVSAIFSGVTGVIIAVSAFVAWQALRNSRSQRKAEILRDFWTNLYRDQDARDVFISISNDEPLNLERKRRHGLAHLLDALNTIAIISKDDKALLEMANRTTIAYVAVKTYRNREVQAYLEVIAAEHQNMGLEDPGFRDFRQLAAFLASGAAAALRQREAGDRIARRPQILAHDARGKTE